METSTKKFLISASLGTYVEFFDFALYAAMASIFANKFFIANAHYVWLAFWVSFVARPIGAVFFGYIGDKYSCKFAMLLSLILMSISTALIGCLPTYKQIGIYAPLLLVSLRFIQGMAVSSEYNGAPVYLSLQHISQKNNNLLCSINGVATILGIISAGVVVSRITVGYEIIELPQIRWRIVYIMVALIVGVSGVALRLSMHDCENRNKCKTRFPLYKALKNQWKEMGWCFFISGYSSALFYMFFAYIPSFLEKEQGYHVGISLNIVNYGACLMVVTLILAAILSDKIGKIKVIKLSGYVLVCMFPVLWLLICSKKKYFPLRRVSYICGNNWLFYRPFTFCFSFLFFKRATFFIIFMGT